MSQGGQCIQRRPTHPIDSTGGMARPRPQLPQQGQLGGHGSTKGGVEDLGEVLDSLKTTDFVRKYSRKGRGSASSSPVGSLSGSGPSSPQSGLSTPQQGCKAATLTRMTSLRAKLERAQAATEQDRLMAVMGLDPTGGQRLPRTKKIVRDSKKADKLNKNQGEDKADKSEQGEAEKSTKDQNQDQNTGDQDSQKTDGDLSEKKSQNSDMEGTNTSLGDTQVATDIVTEEKDGVQKFRSTHEIGGSVGHSKTADDSSEGNALETERLSPDLQPGDQGEIVVPVGFSHSKDLNSKPSQMGDSEPKELDIVSEVVEPQRVHFTGMISRERVVVTTKAPASSLGENQSGPGKDSDASLQGALTTCESVTTRHIPAIDTQLLGDKTPPPKEGSQSMSVELEDEGVGATDLASSRYQVAYSSVVLGAWIDNQLANTGHTLSEITEADRRLKSEDLTGDSSSLGDATPRRLLKLPELAQGSAQMNKPPGGGRFLTHPPLRERSVTKEVQGSVDSNGLYSLREGSRDAAGPAGELSAQPSEVSLDSHLCPSDTQEGPSYGDVLHEVTSDVADLGKKRNGKLPKFKSKSDPTSGKHKTKSAEFGTSGEDKDGLGKHSFKSHHSRVRFLKEKSKSEDGLLSEGLSGGPGCKYIRGTGKGDSETAVSTKRVGIASSDIPKQSVQSSFNAREKQHSIEEEDEDEDEDEDEEGEDEDEDEDEEGKPSPQTTVSRLEIQKEPVIKLTRASTAPSTPIQSPDTPVRRYFPSAGQAATLPLPSRYSPKLGESRTLDVPTSSSWRSPSPRPHLPDSLSLMGHGELLSGSSLAMRGEGSYQSLSRSASNLLESKTSEDNLVKRDHIVLELVGTERHYVGTLQMLVERYMVPLKAQPFMDSGLVDDVFYRVNEIYMHHATFLSFLERALRAWTQSSTVGDIIYRNFSKETVIENYVSFIEHFPRAEKVLDALSTKSAFSRFIEQCEKETGNKLPLKAHIVKPAQRIPRYELLLKRLLDHTPMDHPDWSSLKQAEASMHHLAMRINSVKEAKRDEDLLGTLKRLELLMFTELVSTDRLYLRYDLIHVLGRKDQCCVWLFSDLLVLTSIKRKSGPVSRKATLLLLSPSGQDFVENTKHKVWLKVGLQEVTVSHAEVEEPVQELPALESLETDFKTLTQLTELASSLTCPHQALDESVSALLSTVNRQLSQHQLKSPPSPDNRLDLSANTPEGPVQVSLVFPSEDKRSHWETVFNEARSNLAKALSDRPPDFLQSLQITKTRAGMQFSCAASYDHVPGRVGPEVWVCNSDGYVGHVCLLSLVPEPIVSLNTPVPGCSARITAICHVPALDTNVHTKHKQDREMHRHSWDSEDEGESESDGSESTHSSEHQLGTSPSRSHISSQGSSTPHGDSNTSLQDVKQSTMWLGTEDGRLHVFLSTDNIKTTRQRMRIHHNAAVHAIVYLKQKVFVALANGEMLVYQRSSAGGWDMEYPQVVILGNSSAPVVRMAAVGDVLWCSCQNNILILDPSNLHLKHQFTLPQEVAPRGVACLAVAGSGVWVAPQTSSTLLLYHSATYQQLLDISIAPAVANKLQLADDIIRQHKTACLRVTSLLACRDSLWVGTSAGVVLTLPLPHLSASTTPVESLSAPPVTGLMQGHTGHVRFLTSVELPADSSAPSHVVSRTLVISGGDGCEDFRGHAAPEGAGREDSTNHLLLWKV